MLQASNCTLFSRRHVPMSLVSMAFLGPVRNSASSRCQDARRPSCWVFCWTSTWHRDAQLTGTLAAVHHGGHSGKKQSCNTPGNGFPTWRMMQRGLIHKTIRVGSQIGMPRRELVIVMATLNPSPACPPRMHFISLKSVVEWLAWDIAASACSPCNAPTAAQRNVRLGNFICACVQQPGRLWSRRAGHTIALALHELKGRLHPTIHTLDYLDLFLCQVPLHADNSAQGLKPPWRMRSPVWALCLFGLSVSAFTQSRSECCYI